MGAGNGFITPIVALVVAAGLGACGSELADSEPAETDTAADDQPIDEADDALGDAAANDDRLAESMDVFADLDPGGPGCAAAVRHADGVEDIQFGLADVSTGQPITASTIFDIGSVSKQMTAGVIAVQAIEGDLALDESVADYVDGLPAGSADATIADLVHHTSGLPDYTELLDEELDEITDTGDAIDAVRDEAETNFDPGTEFEYSNTNYVLLSEIAATASDSTFVELSDTLVFEPLGMESTVVRDDQGDLLDGQATGYEAVGDGTFDVVSSSWRQTGDGAVHSTPVDVLRWAEVFIEPIDGEPVVGSPEWVELMLQPGDVPDDGVDYAFGVSVEDGLISHSGSWIGYSSYLAVIPDDGVAVAISCNIDEFDADSLGNALLDIWS